MKKTGELTTQQLVTIIILIVSFSVILFFIFRLNLGGEATNKEICHNSVLMKSKSLNPISSGPLDCRTNYICISGGEECEDFNSKQEIVKINLDKKSGEPDDAYNERVKNQIMKSIADEMSDCWWMFGEGKVDYVGGSFSGTSSCAICSVVAFDKDIQSFAGEINQNDKITYGTLFNYLKTNEKETGKSYLYYLYEINNYDEKKPFFQTTLEFSKSQEILTGIYKENFFLKVFSAPWGFTKSFFVDDEGKNKETGPITVIILPKENIGNLGCSEFITKA